MKRRQLLSMGGVVSVVSLSGCTAVLGGNDTRLVGIAVVNHSQEQETIRLRVDQDEEAVEDSTHVLDPNTYESIDCTWREDAGNFIISSQLDGDNERTELDLDDYDLECAYVYANVNPRGGILDFAISDECEHENAC